MKYIFLILAAALFVSCNNDPVLAEMEIDISGVEAVSITHPIEDFLLWHGINTDRITPNDSGLFLFQKQIEAPQFVRLELKDGERIRSILIPGLKHELRYVDSAYIFVGKNAAGLNYLNSIERTYEYNERDRMFKKSDTTVDLTIKRIETIKNEHIEYINSLQTTDSISKEMQEALNEEITYYYGWYAQNALMIKVLKNQYNNKEEIKKAWASLETEISVNTDYKAEYWSQYSYSKVFDQPSYFNILEGSITRDTLQRMWKEDKLHPMEYTYLGKYQDLDISEKLSAFYILRALKEQGKQKSLIKLFDKFSNEYPESRYIKHLKPGIEEVIAYQEAINRKMPDNIKFLESDKINTMDQLLTELKGQKYFVDVWASWCGPCKEEFKHNNELFELLNTLGYKKLYISLDRDTYVDSWNENIKFYQLSGLHLRASHDFFVDFENNHSTVKSAVTIPQYMIIDDSGTIVTNDAPRPSEIDKLQAALK